jgi:hypothetical protein
MIYSVPDRSFGVCDLGGRREPGSRLLVSAVLESGIFGEVSTGICVARLQTIVLPCPIMSSPALASKAYLLTKDRSYELTLLVVMDIDTSFNELESRHARRRLGRSHGDVARLRDGRLGST